MAQNTAAIQQELEAARRSYPTGYAAQQKKTVYSPPSQTQPNAQGGLSPTPAHLETLKQQEIQSQKLVSQGVSPDAAAQIAAGSANPRSYVNAQGAPLIQSNINLTDLQMREAVRSPTYLSTTPGGITQAINARQYAQIQLSQIEAAQTAKQQEAAMRNNPNWRPVSGTFAEYAAKFPEQAAAESKGMAYSASDVKINQSWSIGETKRIVREGREAARWSKPHQWWEEKQPAQNQTPAPSLDLSGTMFEAKGGAVGLGFEKNFLSSRQATYNITPNMSTAPTSPGVSINPIGSQDLNTFSRLRNESVGQYVVRIPTQMVTVGAKNIKSITKSGYEGWRDVAFNKTNRGLFLKQAGASFIPAAKTFLKSPIRLTAQSAYEMVSTPGALGSTLAFGAITEGASRITGRVTAESVLSKFKPKDPGMLDITTGKVTPKPQDILVASKPSFLNEPAEVSPTSPRYSFDFKKPPEAARTAALARMERSNTPYNNVARIEPMSATEVASIDIKPMVKSPAKPVKLSSKSAETPASAVGDYRVSRPDTSINSWVRGKQGQETMLMQKSPEQVLPKQELVLSFEPTLTRAKPKLIMEYDYETTAYPKGSPITGGVIGLLQNVKLSYSQSQKEALSYKQEPMLKDGRIAVLGRSFMQSNALKYSQKSNLVQESKLEKVQGTGLFLESSIKQRQLPALNIRMEQKIEEKPMLGLMKVQMPMLRNRQMQRYETRNEFAQRTVIGKSEAGKTSIGRYSTMKKKRYRVSFFDQYKKKWVPQLSKESPFQSASSAQRYGAIVSLKKKKFTGFMVSEDRSGENMLRRPDKVPQWQKVAKRFYERESLGEQPNLQGGARFKELPPKGRKRLFR